jgi:hypothetical protein
MSNTTIINVADIMKLVTYDSGYNINHRIIKLFWHLLSTDLSQEQLGKLFLFWTGTKSIPRESDISENNLTISKLIPKKRSSSTTAITSDRKVVLLPEASTCDRNLYLPEYSSLAEMRRAVVSAIEYGCLGFDKA